MKPRISKLVIPLVALFTAIVASELFAQSSPTKFLPDASIPELIEETFGEPSSTRPSFLVIPLAAPQVAEEGAANSLLLLLSFYQMYPEANLPHEFSNLSVSGTKLPKAGAATMYPSILLTMAHQQGYGILAITDSYVVLVKDVEAEPEETAPQ